MLALTSGDLSTGTGALVLTLASGATCSGTTDVISGTLATGGVKRQGFVSGGAALCMGNPLNTIKIDSGTAPADLTLKLVKSPPSGKGNAINRTYTISPTFLNGFTATLRLRYLATELNGNTDDGTLRLWHLNGSWGAIAGSTNNLAQKWVEKSGLGATGGTTFSGDWTIAD